VWAGVGETETKRHRQREREKERERVVRLYKCYVYVGTRGQICDDAWGLHVVRISGNTKLFGTDRSLGG
jgi:hypothetical protein